MDWPLACSIYFCDKFYLRADIFDGLWCCIKLTFKNIRPYVELVTKIYGTCQRPVQNISPPPLEKSLIVMGIAIK